MSPLLAPPLHLCLLVSPLLAPPSHLRLLVSPLLVLHQLLEALDASLLGLSMCGSGNFHMDTLGPSRKISYITKKTMNQAHTYLHHAVVVLVEVGQLPRPLVESSSDRGQLHTFKSK